MDRWAEPQIIDPCASASCNDQLRTRRAVYGYYRAAVSIYGRCGLALRLDVMSRAIDRVCDGAEWVPLPLAWVSGGFRVLLDDAQATS
jgi:hypothetical protein